MSTGLECNFIEPEPGVWYYLLENYDAPKMSWDWREYSTAYGPFTSKEKAIQHLSDNHANPGGWMTDEYREGRISDEVEQKLIKEASNVDRQRLRYYQ